MADAYYDYHGLQAEAEKLCRLEGWAESDPPADWGALVNQAWAEFSWDTECVEGEGTATTAGVSAGPEFLSLSAPSWKTILHCRYGTGDTYLLETSLRAELAANPHLFTAGTSTPTRYAISEPDVLVLIPGATTASVTVTFRGIREGAAMSSDNDEPACPKVFRRGIVYRAVILHAESYAFGESRGRLPEYQAKYDGEVTSLRRYLSALRNRGTMRTTSPRLAERVSI